MLNYIKCEEEVCPYGKKSDQRCIFGEVFEEDLMSGIIIRERHKCPKAKAGKLQYVTITIKINN